jgi:hypothetical protein
VPRSRAQIEGFFNGFDLLPPGVAGISQWPLPDPGGAAMHFYGGVAVKPAVLQVCDRPGEGRPGRYLSSGRLPVGGSRSGGTVGPVDGAQLVEAVGEGAARQRA